jgi:carbonic anhydrase/acetyltransferase-like protein (isoleucine patch superfamily)
MTAWERLMRRVASTLRYYAEHETPEQRSDRYRALGVTIGPRTVIYDSLLDPVHPGLLTIGADCTITGAELLCHDDSLIPHRQRQRAAPVTIGDRVFIGRRAVVLPGRTIGSDVIVGAGSIVTKDIEARSVVAGNPARTLMSLDDFLKRSYTDPSVIDLEVAGTLGTVPVLEQLRTMAQARWFKT